MVRCVRGDSVNGRDKAELGEFDLLSDCFNLHPK
jgi:hypothetical protein